MLATIRKWSRRHRPFVSASVATLLVSALVVAGSIGWAIRDRRAMHTAMQASELIMSRSCSLLRGRDTEALADYKEALALRPGYYRPLEGIAWLLAAAHDEKLVDGKRAVEWATKACESTTYSDPKGIATLAAAYAEAGDFPKAIEWSERAIELAGEQTSAGKLYAPTAKLPSWPPLANLRS